MDAKEYLDKIAIVLGEDENGNEVYFDQNEDAYKQVLIAMESYHQARSQEEAKDVGCYNKEMSTIRHKILDKKLNECKRYVDPRVMRYLNEAMQEFADFCIKAHSPTDKLMKSISNLSSGEKEAQERYERAIKYYSKAINEKDLQNARAYRVLSGKGKSTEQIIKQARLQSFRIAAGLDQTQSKTEE